VEVGVRTLVAFLYEAARDHALDRAVERAGAELDIACGAGGDLALDGVPVALLIGEGEEDLELGHGQRQHRLRIGWAFHGQAISRLNISSIDIISGMLAVQNHLDGTRGTASARGSELSLGIPTAITLLDVRTPPSLALSIRIDSDPSPAGADRQLTGLGDVERLAGDG